MQKAIYGSVVWFVSTLFVIYVFILTNIVGIFSDNLKDSFHTTNTGVSWALASFVIGFACMQIPAGYLLDRYNARFLVGSAVLLVVIGNIIISHSNNIVVFSLANFLQGVGASFDFIAASILISQWFSKKMFPILTGLIESSASIFAGVMHYFFILALKSYTWHQLYYYLSVFGIVLFILTLLIIKSPKDYHFSMTASFKRSLKTVCRNPQLWLCAISAATSFAVLLAYAEQWYVQIQKYYAVDDIQTGIIGGLFFIGIGIGFPLLGWISNLLKSRKIVLHLSLVLGNMILLLAIYLPHFPIETLIPIKIVSFLTGFSLSGSMLFYTMVSEMSSNHTRGIALSITNTCIFLFNSAILLIPYLSITARSFEFFTYLWTLPFCIMISILLLYFVRETYTENPGSKILQES